MPESALLSRHRDKNGEISKKHGKQALAHFRVLRSIQTRGLDAAKSSLRTSIFLSRQINLGGTEEFRTCDHRRSVTLGALTPLLWTCVSAALSKRQRRQPSIAPLPNSGTNHLPLISSLVASAFQPGQFRPALVHGPA